MSYRELGLLFGLAVAVVGTAESAIRTIQDSPRRKGEDR